MIAPRVISARKSAKVLPLSESKNLTDANRDRDSVWPSGRGWQRGRPESKKGRPARWVK